MRKVKNKEGFEVSSFVRQKKKKSEGVKGARRTKKKKKKKGTLTIKIQFLYLVELFSFSLP